MRLRVSKDVDSHHTNPDYECLIVEWNGEKNFRCRANGSHDWLPTDQELVDLLVASVKISPTLWLKLCAVVKPTSDLTKFM